MFKSFVAILFQGSEEATEIITAYSCGTSAYEDMSSLDFKRWGFFLAFIREKIENLTKIDWVKGKKLCVLTGTFVLCNNQSVISSSTFDTSKYQGISGTQKHLDIFKMSA